MSNLDTRATQGRCATLPVDSAYHAGYKGELDLPGPEHQLASAAENRRGILAMLAAMALFCANDTLVKLATQALPVSQVITIRSAFASLVAVALIASHGALQHVRLALTPLVAGRALLEATVAVGFITALAHMPLATITVIGQSTPIIMSAIVALLGFEAVGWRRWSATLVGFAGVMIVLRPTETSIDVYGLLTLGCSAVSAFRDLTTRWIGVNVPSTIVTLAATVAVTAVGAALGLIGAATGEPWMPLAPRELAYLVVAGVLVTVGNYANVVAFRGVDVSVVSPFRYSVILWAIFFGLVVFGDPPDALAMVGAALIVASGIYTIHRERVRRAAMDAR
jgi:drug/metabolite transporter (DMT)-like permease